MENELIKIENVSVEAIEAQQRAEYDIQISTAKRYPRDLTRVRNNSIAIATMDKDTAESCRYALPRGGKSISGASVHLARIIAQQYGNLRVNSGVRLVSDKEIVCEAVAFDLESNYAVKTEVRRKITDRNGIRYNDDMIVMTGNAASAIAYRNAVFAVIPKAITDACYKAAQELITGDVSDETKLIKRRNEVIQKMKDSYNVTEEQILKAINLRSINQVKAEQIADLIAIGQAIKDGDTTVEQVFHIVEAFKPEPKKEYKTEAEVKKDQLAGALSPSEAKKKIAELKRDATGEIIDKPDFDATPSTDGGKLL